MGWSDLSSGKLSRGGADLEQSKLSQDEKVAVETFTLACCPSEWCTSGCSRKFTVSCASQDRSWLLDANERQSHYFLLVSIVSLDCSRPFLFGRHQRKRRPRNVTNSHRHQEACRAIRDQLSAVVLSRMFGCQKWFHRKDTFRNGHSVELDSQRILPSSSTKRQCDERGNRF